jgi:serine-type D-Ala-D-Ala carboxypeptidase/endopeptidase
MNLAWVAGVAVVACGTTPSSRPPAPAPESTGTVAAKPSLSGIWLGTLQARNGKRLRAQLHLDDKTCSVDSLDQRQMGIPCTNVVLTASSLSFDVPSVAGTLKGTVAADTQTITATWTQRGADMPLVLTRQAKAIAPPEPSKPAFDPAIAAVGIEKIQAVLDADLAKLVDSAFAPATGVGVAIGIVEHGTRKVFSYGGVKANSLFELGSITKTFTGLVLAQMVEQKTVRFDEPVRELLPKATAAQPAGKEITLLDLSTQRSGLPRMPDNFHPKDEDNPYVDYDAKALYAYVASHGVALPEKQAFLYSNLGVGLLGQALADRANLSYEALVRKEVLDPLGMKDTSVKLTPELTKRFATGHDEDGKPAHAWDLDALAGAGALRSTAADMLTYVEAQLHPEKVKGSSAEAKTLPAALAASHVVHGEATDGHIALIWIRIDDSGMYWHDGGTGGFRSYAAFDPAKDFGVVVLLNSATELADPLGQHIVQRLTGQPAVSLVRP